MRIKLWGTRGSLPAPLLPEVIEKQIHSLFLEFFDYGYRERADVETFLRTLPAHRRGGFGGNTVCIEVSEGDQQVIIDGGSGLRQLGYELMNGPCGEGKGEAHILFTHFHWDHLIGLPFFTPLFIPGNKVHVYAVQDELPEVFKTVFRKPYFPVELENLGAEIIYHQLDLRAPQRLGQIQFTPYQLDHPDPCFGYRFEAAGKVFSHCVDTECSRFSREELGADLPLYQDVDLMLFDAQYTLLEQNEKVNWGHASASLGLDIAMREGIRKILFMHHDPASSTEKIVAAEEQARRYYDAQLRQARRSNVRFHEVDWSFAREGTVIEL